MKRFVVIFLASVLMMAQPCCALDWKNLHEQADRLDSKTAFAQLQKNPQSIDNLYVLGLVYFNEHKNDEAAALFEKMAAQDPSSLEAQWGRAEVLRRKHNLKESTVILNEIIKKNPHFYPAYISLAYLKYTERDFMGAVRLAGIVADAGALKAVDTSNHARAHLIFGGAKGMLAHYGGPMAKAIHGTQVYPNIKKAQKMQPNSPGVYFGMGAFYLLAPSIIGGNSSKAEEYLQKAVSADPLFADAYARLGQVYQIKGDVARFQAMIQKALEIDPQNELALDIQSGACKFICVKDGDK